MMNAPRIAVVTGAAAGIGYAYAAALARCAYDVAVLDIQPDVFAAPQRLPQRIAGSDHTAFVVDVGSEASVSQVAADIGKRYGKVDVLINNAAIMLQLEKPFKPFEETSWDEWRRVFDVNVGGAFLMTRELLPLLEKSEDACVINISSDAVWKGYDGQLAYFTSKGAIQTLTRCLARELGRRNIRVNCIAPGYTLSEAVRANEVMMDLKGLVQSSCVIIREQTPEDVANMAIFLASPQARCISGQTFIVNCGSVMP
jgi:NAD(P)-dependent dehydrogenase (short-subunit alcohol dehydrogenase family)